MSQDLEQLVVGRLGAVYGIRGWLKIHSFTDIPESIFDYGPWLIDQRGNPIEIKVEKFKQHGKGWIVKLEGIDVREEAQLLTGAEISVASAQLPELNDEFYWHDLIGCKVVSLQGYDFGQVSDLMETGSNDVLLVKANPVISNLFGSIWLKTGKSLLVCVPQRISQQCRNIHTNTRTTHRRSLEPLEDTITS